MAPTDMAMKRYSRGIMSRVRVAMITKGGGGKDVDTFRFTGADKKAKKCISIQNHVKSDSLW